MKSMDHLIFSILTIFQKQKLYFLCHFNQFQPSVTFHIETSHLICTANQTTGFYMKSNTWLKWVNGSYKWAHSVLLCEVFLEYLELYIPYA